MIGINYKGTRAKLDGCINDVRNTWRSLVHLGFQAIKNRTIKVLTEEDEIQPTRANILSAISWLTRDAKAGDVFYFHYSGHGAQLRDSSGDEADGKDESIIPLDFQRSGSINDDELDRRLLRPLPVGVTIFCIFDCCHSGAYSAPSCGYDAI